MMEGHFFFYYLFSFPFQFDIVQAIIISQEREHLNALQTFFSEVKILSCTFTNTVGTHDCIEY